MAENEDTSRQTVSVEDALRTQIVINQALIELLVTKKVFSKEELLNQVRSIRDEVGTTGSEDSA